MSQWAYKIFGVQRAELRSVFLLICNLFFIVSAYYVIKSLRGALVLQHLGAESLPTLWILSVLSFSIFVGAYSKIVDRCSRLRIVTYTTLFFTLTLLFLYSLFSPGTISFLNIAPTASSGIFYVWSELFAVILVEQFWTFTNDVLHWKQAKRLFAVIGAGGLLGGFFGGWIVSNFAASYGTSILLLSAVALLLLTIFTFFLIQKSLSGGMNKRSTSLYLINSKPPAAENYVGSSFKSSLELIFKSRYLQHVCLFVVLAQAISTVIDFQFNQIVESLFITLEQKSVFFGQFYMLMNLVSFATMLIVAMPMHRYVGVIAGLMVLPLVNFLGISLLLIMPAPMLFMAVKLLDKSMVYSIFRTSKELLYVPTTREEKFKAKAVIDILGNRISRVLVALGIMLYSNKGLTQAELFTPINFLLAIALIAVSLRLRSARKEQINGLVAKSPQTPPVSKPKLARS